MHNSLHIRDLLRRTNNSPMYRARRDPHLGVTCDPAAAAGRNEFELTGSWRGICSADPSVDQLVVDDVQDFLVRIGVRVADDAGQTIDFSLASDLAERDCRFRFEPGNVRVEGGGISGLWAGLAWLEFEMRWRRGPFLPRATMTRKAAWDTQISQGPWGGNYSVPDFSPEYLSDESFRLYAHYGVNSMMIYGDLLCYINSTIFPELNYPDYARNIATLKDAARRAARYGVKFSYVVVGPKLRPDHPLFVRLPHVRGTGMQLASGTRVHVLCCGEQVTRDFYQETFSKLFAEAPELAGLILIVAGESMYHCKMWRPNHHAPADRFLACPKCWPRETEDVVAEVVETVRRGVHSSQPGAYVASWAYTVNGWERQNRDELIGRLPPGTAMFHHIEKDQWLKKDGYTKHVWDYSIDFQGPSDEMVRVAEKSKEARLPLFVKTETGIGLEVFQYPYVPAMQRLAEKWEKVRALRPRGVHQSWLFFGMFNSRAEALGLWAAYAPELSQAEFLRRLAVRDFGPRAAGKVLASWQHMSDAMGHLPMITFAYYYIGPSFLGPAHPLVPRRDAVVSPVFDGHLFYLQETEESFSVKQISETRTCLVMKELPPAVGVPPLGWQMQVPQGDGWQVVAREYAAAASDALAAWRSLQQAESLVATAEDRRQLKDELLLTELIYRTNKACENSARFLIARGELEANQDGALAEMKRIALAERENAADALHIYREAPWLDLPARTDGYFSSCIDMINEKLRMHDAFLAGSD